MRLGNFSRVLPGISLFVAIVAVALCAARGAARLPGGPSRVLVPDSVVLPIGNPGDPNHPRILRAQLSAGELAQPFPFSIALRMRDFAGLQARIAAGQRIPRSEMEAKYLPLASDYQKVADWLVARGFTLTQHDINHTLLFATGTAAQVQAAFGVSLARVAAADGNYSAATSAPSLPADLSSHILSVNGLQPYARLRHIHVEALPGKPLAQLSGGDFVAPQDVNAAYHMPTGWTGKGQTICVIDELPVPNADFTQFWQVAQVPQTVANLTVINLGGDTSTLNSQDVLETALDVEWVGAVAPEAKIRLYLAANVFSCFAQIATDQASDPSMSVLSISYVALENALSQGTIRTMSQEFAQMAAAGMSIVASSGDGGSNSKDGTFGSYDASQPAEVGYPASDMNVTGVGGTVVYYNFAWSLNGEQVWNSITAAKAATGGGVSTLFAKPSWQTGGAVLQSATKRCVPDVAAISEGYYASGGQYIGAFAVYNGAPQALIGTSWSAPIWAGLVADVNQARASMGEPVMGLLNPSLYPLAGSTSFFDVISGSNGAYSAGVGYDLCTGLGSPVADKLLAALVGKTLAPVFVTQPQDVTVWIGADVTLAAGVHAIPEATYQWQFNGTNLTDSASISGSNTLVLRLSSAQPAQSGTYTLIASNGVGSPVTSRSVQVSINTEAPVITSQPVDKTVFAGDPVSFSVAADGHPAVTYQWQFNGANIVEDSRISGSKTSSLSISQTQVSDAGNYTCVVSNGIGSPAVSRQAVLTVNNQAPVISTQPVSLSQSSYDRATFTVVASGHPALSYQWQFNGKDLQDLGNVSGSKSDTLSIYPTHFTDAGTYTVIITNGVGNPVVSDPATLTLHGAPEGTVSAPPPSSAVAGGASVTMSVSALAGSETIAYQWMLNSNPIVGATGTSYTIKSAMGNDAGSYSVELIDADGVSGVSVGTLTVTAPTATIVTGASGGLALGSSTTLAVTGKAAKGTLSYQWYHNGTAVAGATSASLPIASIGLADTGTYSVLLKDDSGSTRVDLGVLGINQLVSVSPYSFPLVPGSIVYGANFYDNEGMAYGPDGSLYVVDSDRSVVLKVAPDGTSSLLAGMPTVQGNDDGPGATATFRIPTGLAVDKAGNVYVADRDDDTIRKIDTQGNVTTFAGAHQTVGSSDGVGAAARFKQPEGLAIDTSGNLYVADEGNDTIREIKPDGTVSTVAGWPGQIGERDGPGAAARFTFPQAVAMGPGGVLYVADRNVIRTIAPDGTVSTLAGGYGSVDGIGAAAGFSQITSIAVDGNGNVYAVDEQASTVRKIAPDGTVTTLAGGAGYRGATFVETPGVPSIFDPVSVTVNPHGTVLIHDANQRIRAAVAADVPVITQQPVAPAGTVGDQVPVTFSVTASGGSALSYRWQKNQADLVDDGRISGSRSATLTISVPVTGDAGQYSVIVSTATGAVRSASVALKVAGPQANPSFLHPIQFAPGSAAFLSLDLSGTTGTVSYQWNFNGTAIPNATANTYSINSVSYADSGAYSVLVSDAAGATLVNFGTLAFNLPYYETPWMLERWVVGQAAAANQTISYLTAPFKYLAGVVTDSTGNVYLSDSLNDVVYKVDPSGNASVFAGSSGQMGSGDGTGTAARFSGPAGLAIDSQGNLYVADSRNSTVRKITPGGVVSTVAGAAGVRGSADGPGTVARFVTPGGIALGADGSVYVTDWAAQTVRKIAPDGTVSTVAGNYDPSAETAVDGTGTSVRFMSPSSIAVDSKGNLFVGDSGLIRKIAPTGDVSTVAGNVTRSTYVVQSADGLGTAASFSNTGALAVDAQDNLYVCDQSCIRKVDTLGRVTTVAGQWQVLGTTLSEGAGPDAPLYGATGIAIDRKGNFYVCDGFPSLLKGQLAVAPAIVTQPSISSSTVASGSPFTLSVAASGLPAPTYQWQLNGVDLMNGGGLTGAQSATLSVAAAQGQFAGTYTVVVRNGAGQMTSSAVQIQVIAPAVKVVAAAPSSAAYGSTVTMSISATASGGSLSYVWLLNGQAIAGATGTSYTIANLRAEDVGHYTVAVTDANGTTVADLGTIGAKGWSYESAYAFTALAGGGSFNAGDGVGAAARLGNSEGLVVDSAGNVVFADEDTSTIREVSPAGVVTTIAGLNNARNVVDGPANKAEFWVPSGLAYDSAGNLYIADTGSNTIRKLDTNGMVSTVAGTAGVAGYVDGQGTAAKFNEPTGIAVDAAGNLFVTDAGNNVIRKITPAGVVTTFAGSKGVAGITDGTGTNAKFYNLRGLAIDAAGNLYVAQGLAGCIRKVSPLGVVTTIAGSNSNYGSDGPVTSAAVGTPDCLCVDAKGTIYFTDTTNGLVKKLSPDGFVTTVASVPNAREDRDGMGPNALIQYPEGIALGAHGELYVMGGSVGILHKGTPVAEPAFVTQPPAQRVVIGGSLTLTAAIINDLPATYQWFKDGNAVAGANAPTLTISAVQSADAGSYTVKVTTSAGSVVSAPAAVTVAPSNRFLDISTRCYVGTGSSVGVAGFVLATPSVVLVRAGGPSLAGFGVSNTLQKPELTIYDASGKAILSNTGWKSPMTYLNGTQAQSDGSYRDDYGLQTVSSAVNAFGFTTNDDSAITVRLPAGLYTAEVKGADGGTGNAIVEVYVYKPPTQPDTGNHFMAISTRCFVGTGDSAATVGLVLESASKVLIRAVGPSLTQYKVSGVVPNPTITLFDGNGKVIGADTGWESDATQAALISAAATAVNDFALTTSADSAMLVTLPAGIYTAQVKDANGKTGNAIVEAYLVPDSN